MQARKILLIGKVGQVGWELRRTLAPLGTVVCVDYPEVDLTEPDSIRKWVRDVQPQLVINAASYTAVDKAETESELAMKINGRAPGVLAEEAKRLGAGLIHYSTDYVYDGTKAAAYVEEDLPNPLSAYGRSKLAGDQALHQVDGDYLVFRLCWVYGARGGNFARTILRLARERDTLRVVRDQVGCPTWSRMIAEATALVAQRTGAGALGEVKGIYHLSATGSTSWHGFAEALVARMPPEQRRCRQIEAIPATEYPSPTRRPANSVLAGGKLARVFGLRLPDWQESLGLVMEALP